MTVRQEMPHLEESKDGMKTITVPVEGLNFASCAQSIEKRLGAAGSVAMVGYAFDGAWAAKNKAAVARFFDIAAQAKDILAGSETEWQRLAPRIGVSDKAGLEIYRQRYSEGIPRRAIRDEEADAKALYRVLADLGRRAPTPPQVRRCRIPSPPGNRGSWRAPRNPPSYRLLCDPHPRSNC